MSAAEGLGPQFGALPPLSEGQKNRVNLINSLRGGRRGDLGSQRKVPVHQRLANTGPYPRQMPVTNMGSLFETLAPGQFNPATLRNATRRLN